jgi:hypothetical protein
MKTIKINPTKLAKIILDNTDKAGSTEWDIYTDINGNLDVRHDSNVSQDWYQIYDLYYGYSEDQLICDSLQKLADWLVSYGIDFSRLELDEWNSDINDFEKITIDWE